MGENEVFIGYCKDVYYVEKMIENGMFPKHGMIWSISGEMHPYDEYKNKGLLE